MEHTIISWLVTIIWIGYGLFAAYQTKGVEEWDQGWLYVFYAFFSPIVFIAKALYGAFKRYE